ncbi:MAG: DUF11 domain-containing protein, partial [Anaerolineae bacterium]|jgi:uncharacterized repeat protein (TIGR01451 family)
VTDESGVATAGAFTANALAGGYSVVGTVDGIVNPANFSLTNFGWYASPSGDDEGDCQTPTTPCATIDGPLEKPGFAPGDTVLVATGTFTGTGDEVVLLDRGVRISGGWDAAFSGHGGVSTLDGEGERRGITVDSGVVALVGRFTVQNGSRTGWQDTGGGIHNAGILSLHECTFEGNEGYFGGGLSNEGLLDFDTGTVSGNSASSGAGIRNAGILTLKNVTISHNSAGEYYGGGITNSEGSSVILRNTILAGNSTVEAGPDCWGAINSAGYNLVGTTADCAFITGPHDLLNVDAGLGPLEGSPTVHPLLPTSPALDAGSCPGVISDQRGLPRRVDLLPIASVDDGCDIGAYEMQALGLTTKTVDPAWAVSPHPVTFTISLLNGTSTDVTGVTMTDTLPTTLTYIDDSLTATSGEYGYSSGIISWTGSVNASQLVTVTFGATVGEGVPEGLLSNTAAISGAGEIVSRTASLDIGLRRIYLPLCSRNYCPDFYDDFSNPASGWAVMDDGYVRTEYLNGEYRVLSKQSGYFYLFQAPTCDRQNYTVEVDARWASTPGSSYGLLFGLASDYSQYYLFDMNTDYEQFRLLRRDPAGFVTVVPVTDASAINSGTASNLLKVTRNGTGITLAINGTVLGTWYDGTIGGLTGVGLVTNPYFDTPSSDGRFDNFAVASLPGDSASAQEPAGLMDEVSGLAVRDAWHDPVPLDTGWQ